MIWVEDDIRTFNHDPVRFGCFCPLHLRAFSKRIGRPVTRGQLVKAILKPGRPHPWRAAWLDLLAEGMIDTVGHLARTVHNVDPDICLGLMSSGHQVHGVEGRRWKPFTTVLADGRPLYSRAPMSNYMVGTLRGLYYSHDSIQGTRHVMPADTIEQTEVENYLYSHYGNSAVFTFLEMAVSFAYGSHGVTLNLFDHCGSPMKDEPIFGRMVADASICLAESADGRRWTIRPEPISVGDIRERPFGDVIVLTANPATGEYHLDTRLRNMCEFPGSWADQPRVPGWGLPICPGNRNRDARRRIFSSYARDLFNWAPLRELLYPDSVEDNLDGLLMFGVPAARRASGRHPSIARISTFLIGFSGSPEDAHHADSKGDSRAPATKRAMKRWFEGISNGLRMVKLVMLL